MDTDQRMKPTPWPPRATDSPRVVYGGQWLRFAREALGISQDDLSAWTGIPKPDLIGLESRRRRPTARERATVELVLGLPAYFLFPRRATWQRFRAFCRHLPGQWFTWAQIERQPEAIFWTPRVLAAMRRERHKQLSQDAAERPRLPHGCPTVGQRRA